MRFSPAFFVLAAALASGSCSRPAPESGVFTTTSRAGIPDGTVLHYVKSNIDGTEPEQVAMRFSGTQIEAFKYHPGRVPAGYVVTAMHPGSMAPSLIQSYQDFGLEGRRLFGTIAFSAEDSSAVAEVPALHPEPHRITVPFFPVHFYNSDLVSLNWVLPFLRETASTFSIGIADPTFGTREGLIFYRGEAEIRFKTREVRNGRDCYVYLMQGPGIGDRPGTLWVDAANHWIHDAEIYFPDNPDWDTFKLKLVRNETLDSTAWAAFMQQALAETAPAASN